MSAYRTEQNFPRAHLWLLIPFAIAIAGFYFSYWSRFTDVPFRRHVHSLTATAWFILLVLQPWLYHKRPISLHRKVGFVGLFLAGGVVFSALTLLPHNIVNPEAADYGITFHNVCAISGFSVSIIIAMMTSKTLSKHARWMITTAIWILQPAVTRLVYYSLLAFNDGKSPIESIYIWYSCLLVSVIPITLMMYLDYKREKRVYASYTFTLIGVTLAITLAKPMGNIQRWIDLCDAVLLRGVR